MKYILSLFFGIFLLINFGCQNKPTKVLKKTKKNNPKSLHIIKRNIPLKNVDDIKDIVKKNENFIKLVESFAPETYSTDELIDLTEKDLKMFKSIQYRHFNSKADTAAVRSRLILAEINLKKLNFLLHKKKIAPDTLQKTFNEIVKNLNSVITKIKLYSDAPDEFESILAHDSMMKIKRDSLFLNQNSKTGIKLNAKK